MGGLLARVIGTAVNEGGEKIPIGDEGSDSVVVTTTFRTVKDLVAVVSEIHRLPRVGGSLHFFKHVASTEANVRKWQDRVSGFRKKIACGCHLNRDIE